MRNAKLYGAAKLIRQCLQCEAEALIGRKIIIAGETRNMKQLAKFTDGPEPHVLFDFARIRELFGEGKTNDLRAAAANATAWL